MVAALNLCIAGLADICDPEDKLGRVSYWGSHSSLSLQGPNLVPTVLGTKSSHSSTGSRMEIYSGAVPGAAVISDLLDQDQSIV